jgi:hypothetical protein
VICTSKITSRIADFKTFFFIRNNVYSATAQTPAFTAVWPASVRHQQRSRDLTHSVFTVTVASHVPSTDCPDVKSVMAKIAGTVAGQFRARSDMHEEILCVLRSPEVQGLQAETILFSEQI